MTHGSRMVLAVALCTALFGACGKKSDAPPAGGTATGPGTAAGSGTAAPAIDAAPPPVAIDAADVAVDAAAAAAAGQATPEMLALDGTLKTLAAIADDDARSKALCKALPTIHTQLRAIAQHPVAGVDPIAWTSQTEVISGGLDEFEMDCADGTPATKPLTEMIEGYPGFFKLMAGQTP